MPSFDKTIAEIFADGPALTPTQPSKSDVRDVVGKMQSYMDGGAVRDPTLLDGKIDIIGGALRQQVADRSQWFFLNDTSHRCVGFDPRKEFYDGEGERRNPYASSYSMLAFWKRHTDALVTNPSGDFYNRIVGCIVAADELLTQEWGITVGGRVTRSGVQINGSMHKQRTARVYHNGTSFLFNTTEIDGAGTVTTSYDSGTGVLTVNHDFLPGNTLHVQPDFRDGSISNVFMPVLKNIVSATQFTVQFVDINGTGAVYTGSPGTKMAFKFTKSYQGAVKFDGTDGWDAIPWSESDSGNIWVVGFMQSSGTA